MVLLISQSLSQICNKVSVSSNSTKYLNDMVSNGIVSPKWSQTTNTPIIIGPSKEIDYIYFIVENSQSQITEKNFNLEFDNKEYASSKFSIDKSKY
jgi:hypothetical protein